MAKPSKENDIQKLIFGNSPLKHWHFEEIVKESGMTRASVNKWLKKYQQEKVIYRVKEKGHFPYFTSGKDNIAYKTKKMIYGLKRLYDSGLIAHLISLEKAKTIIIFGSYSKGDWYEDSDIDIFIYGDDKVFNKHEYEKKLGHDIELHLFRSKTEMKNVRSGLMKNIMDGYLVKGTIQDIVV